MPLGEASPKRKVGGSNPFWRATSNTESLCFQGLSVFYFCQKREKRKTHRFSLAVFPSANGIYDNCRPPFGRIFLCYPMRIFMIEKFKTSKSAHLRFNNIAY